MGQFLPAARIKADRLVTPWLECIDTSAFRHETFPHRQWADHPFIRPPLLPYLDPIWSCFSCAPFWSPPAYGLRLIPSPSAICWRRAISNSTLDSRNPTSTWSISRRFSTRCGRSSKLFRLFFLWSEFSRVWAISLPLLPEVRALIRPVLMWDSEMTLLVPLCFRMCSLPAKTMNLIRFPYLCRRTVVLNWTQPKGCFLSTSPVLRVIRTLWVLVIRRTLWVLPVIRCWAVSVEKLLINNWWMEFKYNRIAVIQTMEFIVASKDTLTGRVKGEVEDISFVP